MKKLPSITTGSTSFEQLSSQMPNLPSTMFPSASTSVAHHLKKIIIHIHNSQTYVEQSLSGLKNSGCAHVNQQKFSSAKSDCKMKKLTPVYTYFFSPSDWSMSSVMHDVYSLPLYLKGKTQGTGMFLQKTAMESSPNVIGAKKKHKIKRLLMDDFFFNYILGAR